MKSLAPGYAPCLNAPVFPEITGVSCADARPQGRTQSTKAGKLSSEFIACQNPGRVLTGCASRNAAVNSGSDRSAPGVPPVERRGARAPPLKKAFLNGPLTRTLQNEAPMPSVTYPNRARLSLSRSPVQDSPPMSFTTKRSARFQRKPPPTFRSVEQTAELQSRS